MAIEPLQKPIIYINFCLEDEVQKMEPRHRFYIFVTLSSTSASLNMIQTVMVMMMENRE